MTNEVKPSLFPLGVICLALFSIIVGLYSKGLFQKAEFSIYDTFVRNQPGTSEVDDRILIVAVNEHDLNNEKLGNWPISDIHLSGVLNALLECNPSVIGLNLYRDRPIIQSQALSNPLDKTLLNNPNIISITKIKTPFMPGIDPPVAHLNHPERVGFNDLPIDTLIDNFMRRGLLYLDDGQTIYHSFALRLVLTYLSGFNIFEKPDPIDSNLLKLGQTTFTPFSADDGAYVNADAKGYQFILDFQGPKTFHTLSFTDILENNYDKNFVKQKIVIIGSTAESLRDIHQTPLEHNWFGVEVHAAIVNQLLRLSLENESLLKTWTNWQELLWISAWCIAGGFLGYFIQSPLRLFPAVISLVIAQAFFNWILFTQGIWILAATPAVCFILTAVIANFYQYHLSLKLAKKALQKSNRQLSEYSRDLEVKVQERTQDLKTKNSELESTIKTLKDTQSQLVMQEKLASLGLLTAGIAHEIKNPLNFITNFALLSVDLVDELDEELEFLKSNISEDNLNGINSVLTDLKTNSKKINEHGKRADTIVKGMLAHSRGKSEQKESININSMLNDYINLVYHGMKARDPDFNLKIEHDFDQDIPKIDVYTQEIGRVFMNIINNACYATLEKSKSNASDFNPTLSLSTKNNPDHVELRIKDNGIGIDPGLKEKIFTPFFSTKPTGEGTGLGMSISYDIITGEHNGTLDFDSRPGEFTEFIITLPKNDKTPPKEDS